MPPITIHVHVHVHFHITRYVICVPHNECFHLVPSLSTLLYIFNQSGLGSLSACAKFHAELQLLYPAFFNFYPLINVDFVA